MNEILKKWPGENLRFVLSPILLKKKYSGMKKHGKKSDNTHACHICSYEVLYSILEKHIDILSHFTDRVYKHIRKEMNREENLVIKPAICNYLGADKKSGDRYCDLIIIQAVQSKRKCDKIIKEVNVINRITNIWKSVNKSKFPPNLKTAFRTEFSQLTDPSNIPIISPRASIDRYM
ncbi:hypothetical protein TRFO_19797 [Tritrichomonas foetus]|uniref:Uncharacterized protein n=1 Tax=Tritrichomonas foetus TaxID=1144522 RepID=A0A1J4KIE6_9EUKA|nr:hypothetical protein TRFO_19797 [Tritrichomonas foetus]|eukprot:OHT10818.1 hypothetical protein TRFO_19797 [Tritrichomonas foetus]